jgi:alpha-L-fucosidase
MNRPWETCMTSANQWAWKPGDPMKSLPQCLRTLISCAGGDGNLLFNVGPMPTGEIGPQQVQRLKEMGDWLSRYGESIYATRGGPYRPTKSLACTRKGNVIYIHVFNWPGDVITLPNLPKQIVSSCLLTGGDCTVKQSAEGITLNVPRSAQQEIDTIIKLELDGPAIDIEPLRAQLSDEIKATASNVFQHDEEYSPEMAFDQDPSTRWATDAGTRSAWVAADLGKPTTFSHFKINEALPHRVEKFEFQIKEDAGWKTIYSGQTIDPKGFAVSSVSAREVRLNILQASEGPTIWEIELER